MPKQDKPLEITEIEKVYMYDLSKDRYTVELLRKGGSLDGEHILMVCLQDANTKAEWGEPFVEGDRTCIPPEFLKEIFEELRDWRDRTGDHLNLFPS